MQHERHIRPLFDEQRIAERTRGMAADIAATRPEDLLAVAVLKGSFMFAADLLRALHGAGLSPQVEFMQLSSYGAGTQSTGQVTVVRDLDSGVEGRDVVLIDDILESGRTLAFAKDLLMKRGARRVMIAVMLEKPGKRAVVLDADFVGFSCPDLFVVGYGMDAARVSSHRVLRRSEPAPRKAKRRPRLSARPSSSTRRCASRLRPWSGHPRSPRRRGSLRRGS